jgi:hypothetical protein
MITPAPHNRRHPAALPPTAHTPHRTAQSRPVPRTVEEAKLNLRVTAARRNDPRDHGHGSGSGSGSIATDLAASAIRFAKDHPAALATGIGVVALVVGPGALLKGVTTAARLATVAGFLGKAATK